MSSWEGNSGSYRYYFFPISGASVVPEYCRATLDRRLLTGETRESILAPIQKLIDSLEKEDSEFSGILSFRRQ